MDSNTEDTLENEETMYRKLLQQKTDDTSGIYLGRPKGFALLSPSSFSVAVSLVMKWVW